MPLFVCEQCMSKIKKQHFYFISIFPEIIKPYCQESILKKAKEKNLVDFHFIDLRDYTIDKRKTVDDTPYGGGAGMVMMVEPLYKAVKAIKKKIKTGKTRVILFSAAGKQFKHKEAKRLQRYYDHIIFICGRYEGIDERVNKYIADEEVSIGEFVLTGGELPALVVADAVTRLVPGVLGNKDSLTGESHSEEGMYGYPQYTKPGEFKTDGKTFNKTKTWKIPDILRSGDHAKIKQWREDNRKQ